MSGSASPATLALARGVPDDELSFSPKAAKRSMRVSATSPCHQATGRQADLHVRQASHPRRVGETSPASIAATVGE